MGFGKEDKTWNNKSDHKFIRKFKEFWVTVALTGAVAFVVGYLVGGL